MENNPSDKDQLAQGVGQVIGELLGAFISTVHALRKQPGFDDAAFCTEIKALLENPAATLLQQHAFRLLLNESPQPTPPPQ